MKRHGRIEQTVDRQTFGFKVDTEKAAKEQIGLAGLDGNRRRDPAALQVPGIGIYVVLRDDPPALQRALRALDRQHAVNQEERLIRQPHPRRESVDGRKIWTEYSSNRANGKLKTCRSVKCNGWHSRLVLAFGAWAIGIGRRRYCLRALASPCFDQLELARDLLADQVE